MKKICIGTLKGGVGKTMLVFNLAGHLASEGKRVLIFDNDPQSNTTNDCGIDKRAKGFFGAEKIYGEGIKAEEIITKSPITQLPTLDIICGSIALTSSDMRLINQSGREHILRKWFKQNEEVLSKYDYVLFDTNPTMSVINQNVFSIADSIILVSDVGFNALEGAEYFIDLWQDICDSLDIENNIKALVVNKVRNTNVDKEYIEYLQEDETMSTILIEQTIPLNVELSRSETDTLPINLFNPESSGGVAYTALVKELLDKEVL
jgi:chromosome partitioning protein